LTVVVFVLCAGVGVSGVGAGVMPTTVRVKDAVAESEEGAVFALMIIV
jgi:hypothetical protein